MVFMLFRMGFSLGTRLIGCTIRHATTERIKAVYFNSKILNVCACQYWFQRAFQVAERHAPLTTDIGDTE